MKPSQSRSKSTSPNNYQRKELHMNTTVRENRNGERTQHEQFVTPASSLVEDGDGYMLQVEMPGVNKEGLEITVENNELTLVGRRSLPAIDGTLIHRESRQNNF